jgi:hypothetical protein
MILLLVHIQTHHINLATILAFSLHLEQIQMFVHHFSCGEAAGNFCLEDYIFVLIKKWNPSKVRACRMVVPSEQHPLQLNGPLSASLSSSCP